VAGTSSKILDLFEKFGKIALKRTLGDMRRPAIARNYWMTNHKQASKHAA
jgi:hypothetical protein